MSQAGVSAEPRTEQSLLLMIRLSVMMFLQYAVWGAWLPVAGKFLGSPAGEGGLGFTEPQIGMLLGLAGSIGAVTAPFIAGQFADRYFRTERFLATLLLIGAGLKWFTATQTSYTAWLWLSIAYSIVYMPTLALSNSLAFSHIRDADKQFPLIRVWGTIGWIAASWAFPLFWLLSNVHAQAMPPFYAGDQVAGATGRLVDALKFSACISLFYSIYCLTLPATPPKRDAVQKFAFIRAFQLFRFPSFTALVVASLAVAAIHQIYFIQAGKFLTAPEVGLLDSQIQPAMTLAQFAEIAVMACLGWMLSKLGFRKIIILGALAYFARYAIWGTVSLPASVLVASQFLHGICYACFFAAGFIYVDRLAPPDARHSAQTVFGIIILGGGPVLGGWLSGQLGEQFTPTGGTLDFQKLWYVLSAIGLATAAFLMVWFWDESKMCVADGCESRPRGRYCKVCGADQWVTQGTP
ncbi:MAG: MFS transporter [Phycisphaerales bacterium]|nr:MFS transporter [Phycisphaerales bacterium]